VPKLDYLGKHSGLRKCTTARHGVVVGGKYVTCPTSQHMKNEKLHVWIYTMATQVAKSRQGRN
jgi:hypothetical protein